MYRDIKRKRLDYVREKLSLIILGEKTPVKNIHISFILFIYLVLTIIYTYPLILVFQTGLPTDRTGIGDELIFVWNIFWTKQALLNFQNPFFTDYIYYPHGTNLAFHSFAFAYSLAAAVLLVLSGGRLSWSGGYNLIVFWSFVSSAFFMYLLVRQLKGSAKAAFCAGIIFSFSTIHLMTAPRLHYLGIEFLPLTLFFYYRWHASHKRINLLLLALSFAILLCNSHIYFLVIAAVVTLDSMVKVFQKRILTKELLDYCLMAMVFFLVSAPIIFALFHDWLKPGDSLEEVFFPLYPAADIANYIFPSEEHIVFPSMNIFVGEKVFVKFFGDVFLTWSLCVSLIVSTVLIKKRGNITWILLAAFSFVFSLGHSLHFLGGRVVDFPLPFAWLQWLFPLMKMFRYPMMFSVFLLLASSVLFAKGADAFWDKTKTFSRSWVAVLPFVVVLLVYVEGLKVPMPVNRPSLPSPYHNLAADDTECGIIEWPLLSIPLSREALYYQMFHKKKLVALATHSGVFPRSKSETTRLILESPFYRFAEAPEEFISLNRQRQDRFAEEDNAFFKENKIKYLLVHMRDVDYEMRASLLVFIRRHNPHKEIYDNNIYLFQLYN